jgi:murein DD-endopeptidase MepM/ murein hydrolase activator NlpD
MPHNGCDFAAMPGTPVYSIAPGIVSFTGNAGPSGNLVTIIHEGGYESGYAHLSKFAPGIGSGTKVDAHVLIGYSGTTGRSTGPHLHLSVKKNGTFIDPLSLKLDGVRVVPPSDRDEFLARKADADAALDAIPMPKAPQPPPVVGVGTAPTGLPASPASPIADDDPQDD